MEYLANYWCHYHQGGDGEGDAERRRGAPRSVPSGRRKSSAKNVRVQDNIRKVPAHERSNRRTRGTTAPRTISAEIYGPRWNNK